MGGGVKKNKGVSTSQTVVKTETTNNAHLTDIVNANFGGEYSDTIINNSNYDSKYERKGEASLHLQHFFIFIGFIIFLSYVIILTGR